MVTCGARALKVLQMRRRQESPREQELDKSPRPSLGTGVKVVPVSSGGFSQMFGPACSLQIHHLEPRGDTWVLIGAIFHCPLST